jgi:hypothetical protein
VFAAACSWGEVERVWRLPTGGGGSSRYLTTFSPGAFEQIKRAGRDRGAWCTRERGAGQA